MMWASSRSGNDQLYCALLQRHPQLLLDMVVINGQWSH